MKKHFIETTFFASAALIFSSCVIESDFAESYPMRAKISFQKELFTASCFGGSSELVLYGFSDSNTTVQLKFPELREGRFELGSSSYAEATVDLAPKYAQPKRSSNFGRDGAGEIVVTEVDFNDSTFSGYFWFDAFEANDPTTFVAVENGYFEAVSFRKDALELKNGLFELTYDNQRLALRQNQTFENDPNGAFFSIDGRNANGLRLSFQFPQTTPVGKHDALNDLTYFRIFFQPEESLWLEVLKSGTLEILRNDPVARIIEGRFDFIVQNDNSSVVENVNDGYFKFNY